MNHGCVRRPRRDARRERFHRPRRGSRARDARTTTPWRRVMVPREARGRIPSRSSARRARAIRRRERRSARGRRSRRSHSTRRRSHRARRSLAETLVARGKVQGAPSCESPKPDRARRAPVDADAALLRERTAREDEGVVGIHARAFSSRLTTSTDRSSHRFLAQSTSDATNSESAPSKS